MYVRPSHLEKEPTTNTRACAHALLCPARKELAFSSPPPPPSSLLTLSLFPPARRSKVNVVEGFCASFALVGRFAVSVIFRDLSGLSGC